MKSSSKVITLITVLAVSGATQVLAPFQAYAASSTKTSLLEQTSETTQLKEVDSRNKCLDSDRRSIRQLLDRIENRTDDFRTSLDRALDRSRLNGSQREDNINQLLREFEDATNRLRERYNSDQDVTNEVREVLRRSSRIDNFMRRQRLDDRAESNWASLRQDLNQLERKTDRRGRCGNDNNNNNNNNRSIKELLNRIESRTNSFRSSLDDALDSSRLNGSQREDNINQLVREFEDATNRLQERSNSNQRVDDELQELLRRASRIDNFMRRQRLGNRAENEWVSIRRDLNVLSRMYNIGRNFY